MTFTLYGEVFNVRTDHIDKVERFGTSLKITYLDGNSDTWSAENFYQLPRINTLEIVLRALEAGYNNGWNDRYQNLKEEGKVLSSKTIQKIIEESADYFPCSSDSCEDSGPGGYSPVD